ncbi:hypothetical protein M378DRAFT_19456 [Amanita muscaria Koide BX008]|uniref:Uncharacterized protein n=1 Tax=Amanita muscaria (strain Koide BX008) TaxID=946122 RepID=A0A0C2VYE8_AMAMK|nr:hypothetical protein M378DRAFT_19456 [Amanita muscaria Koide BX008]
MDQDGVKARVEVSSYLPPRRAHPVQLDTLDAATLNKLAKKFADGISEEEFSIAVLQGYKLSSSSQGNLLRNKYYPEAAADGVMDWVKSEHEVRKVEAREGGKRQPTAQ